MSAHYSVTIKTENNAYAKVEFNANSMNEAIQYVYQIKNQVEKSVKAVLYCNDLAIKVLHFKN